MKSLRTISKLLINILCLRYQLVKIAGPSRLCSEWCPDSRPDQAIPYHTIPDQTRPDQAQMQTQTPRQQLLLGFYLLCHVVAGVA